MIRVIFILLTITALSLGLAWVADEPGRVVIDWGDYHLETSLLVIIACVAIAALWCMIVYYVLFALIRTPRSWLRSRLARRQTLGLEALTSAFAAIATQDLPTARKQIRKAQHYLPHQPLTLMLASQVARMEGNESQSRLYLEQMLKSESTEFVAMRGLIENARRSGDIDAALAKAERALALKPQDPWVITTLTGLYARKERTQDALHMLDLSARKRYITREDQRKLAAGVLYEYAGPLMRQERYDLAMPALHDALRARPGFTPASALLADAYAKSGDVAQALTIIIRAWKAAPHPLLTQSMLLCWEPVKTRKKVTQVAEKLARLHPESRESRFLLAAMALKSGTADGARNEIRHLLDERETVRACTAMAEVENAAGNGGQAAQWLIRAHNALSDPGYACEQCRQPADGWHLTCAHCGSVGSLIWK